MRQGNGKRATSRRNGVVQKTTNNTSNRNVKTKKFKRTRLFKILRIALIILIIILAINIVKGLFHKTPENITLIIGDRKPELTHSVEIDKNNNIYISIDDIKKLYDSNIYYSNNILITTYNKHIAVLEKDKTTMKVNDVVQELKGTLKEINGVIYLPFSDMVDIYDFEQKYNEDTKVLSVDSKSKEKKQAVVLKNCKLKENTKAFADSIEKVKKTQYVTVFATIGKYSKVRTKAGNIGYIKTKQLSKPEILWEDMEDEKLKNVTILNDYNNVNSNYDILQDTKENTIVTPNLFRIARNSSDQIEVQKIMSFENDLFIKYRDWANGSNVEICPTITLDCSMSNVCASYESRSLVINTLYNELVSNKLQMVCVDFKEIDDMEGLYRFLTEMTPRFKCAGMKVLVKYNGFLSKDRLNSMVDYVIE